MLQGDGTAEVERYTSAISVALPRLHAPLNPQKEVAGRPVFPSMYALCNELCLNRQSLILQRLRLIGPANTPAVEQASPT
jgi:hypothetical protein